MFWPLMKLATPSVSLRGSQVTRGCLWGASCSLVVLLSLGLLACQAHPDWSRTFAFCQPPTCYSLRRLRVPAGFLVAYMAGT